jgi:hypothetical protein
MTNLVEIEDPVQRFIAFIHEREQIRIRRERGDKFPWTTDRILLQYRFTNIHREDDRVSKHYQKTIRQRYEHDAIVVPATVLYRWFNRPSTCDFFFNQSDLMSNMSPFEQYIETKDIDNLKAILKLMPPPHVTGAFIIQGKQGYTKGEGVLEYFNDWCTKPWREEWQRWNDSQPVLLEDVYNWIRQHATGLGSFMGAQIVADLKYIPLLMNTVDWHDWAAPGPGSMRGLNMVLDQEPTSSWNPAMWLTALQALNEEITPTLLELGIGKLHNQDLQNCLCEFSKYEKTRLGLGRPRQVFHHV